MLMVCPQCKNSYDHGLECATCHVPLLHRPPRPRPEREAFQPRRETHLSPRARIVLCLLLAWALCYGLMLLFTASLHALHKDMTGGAFTPIAGFSLLAGLQAVAILAVSVLAGAGQRAGTIFGAVMGLMTGLLVSTGIVSGLLTGLAQPFLHERLQQQGQLRALVMFGLPVLHALCGALGGFLGSFIWKPPLVFALQRPKSVPVAGSRRAAAWRVPVPHRAIEGGLFTPGSCLRVFVGIVVAVSGGIYNQQIAHIIVQASDGYLQLVTDEQYRVANGVVFALGVLAGGFVAGAATASGVKQGLCTGLAAGVVLVNLVLLGTVAHTGSLFLLLFIALTVAPLGGWFGSELLPPVVALPTRRKQLI